MVRSTRSALVIAAALVVALAAACTIHDPSKYGVTPDNVNAFLTLTPDRSSVAADGVSTVTLTAAIDPNATSGNRTITFTTTAGTLIAGAGKSTTTLDVTVGADGKAIVQLQSSQSVLICRVTARIKDFVQSVDINFTVPAVDDILVLTSGATSLPADGFSRTRITATVKHPNEASQRTVTFKTSAGSLFSSQAVGAVKTVDVPVDTAGVATVDLQSSATVETAFVSATAAGVTRSTTVPFTAAPVGSIISVQASRATAPADGATLVQVTATIAAAIPNEQRTVTFTTTDGSFANGTPGPGAADTRTTTATPDAGNRAIVDLRAPVNANTVRVTAKVNNVTADTLITFTVALPESLFVSAKTATVAAGADDVITVTLVRSIGTASAGTIVAYDARDNTGAPIGTFGDVKPSNASGVSTATFSPGATTYKGPVTITATAGGISASTVVQIP